MAGISKILKTNEILFNIGDKANSMYIIKKGELKVYLPNANDEICLTTIKDGAIVGEMAFFDDKPRSASVKALSQTEVTCISKQDFDKLLTQIPRWMLSMMQSLVFRLRTTNEKLQLLENNHNTPINDKNNNKLNILPNQKYPYQHVLRIIQLLLLSFAKEGEKDGKDLILKKDFPQKLWVEFFNEDIQLFDKILEIIEKNHFISLRSDAHKTPIIVFINKGLLANFIDFLTRFIKTFKKDNIFWTDAAISLANAIIETITSSSYENLNISVKSLINNYKDKSQFVNEWPKAITELTALNEFKATKTTDDIIFRANNKELKLISSYLKIANLLHINKLA